MRVMLDGVFSHVGDDSLYFNRRGTYGEHVGAYRDPEFAVLQMVHLPPLAG